jgi:hypothetical protein
MHIECYLSCLYISIGRIIELLEGKSYLDQQTIGEMTIIPAREARERLYSLYRDKWVDYVEISKR